MPVSRAAKVVVYIFWMCCTKEIGHAFVCRQFEISIIQLKELGRAAAAAVSKQPADVLLIVHFFLRQSYENCDHGTAPLCSSSGVGLP